MAQVFSVVYSRFNFNMKKFFISGIVVMLLLFAMSFSAQAQNKSKAQRTSGAAAAYGNSVPFKSHVRKNKQKKRQALKSAKRKKLRDSREPYRRGIPI